MVDDLCGNVFRGGLSDWERLGYGIVDLASMNLLNIGYLLRLPVGWFKKEHTHQSNYLTSEIIAYAIDTLTKWSKAPEDTAKHYLLRSIGSKYKTPFWKDKGLPFDREQQLIINRLDTLQKQ